MKRLIPLAAASFLFLAVVASLFAPSSWRRLESGAAGEKVPPLLADALRPIGDAALLPLPPIPALPADKVALGRRLFFDPCLSRNDTIACASCHDFSLGGADGRTTAVGIDGRQGPINTPSVFNAALAFAQFWDGRAATLEEQVASPIHNPLEMGSNWAEVIAKLERDEAYRQAFAAVYGERGINPETIADAIAAFERTLLTPSRYDAWLKGDRGALDETEQKGLQLFLDYGCASCHQGVLLGGNLFQRFGVMADYFAGRTPTPADLGRYNVTGREEDRHVFKVPSLRNVALTAPYFHDASAATLEDAIMAMGRYQLGRTLTKDEIAALAAFLRSLTGTLPESAAS